MLVTYVYVYLCVYIWSFFIASLSVTNQLKTVTSVMSRLNQNMDPATISQTIARMSQEMMRVLSSKNNKLFFTLPLSFCTHLSYLLSCIGGNCGGNDGRCFRKWGRKNKNKNNIHSHSLSLSLSLSLCWIDLICLYLSLERSINVCLYIYINWNV